MNKLSVKGLALGIGIAWGGLMLILAWAAMLGWGGPIIEMMSSIYIGYDVSFVGSIIGAVWGFADGVICGIIVSLVYNWVVKEK